MNVTETTRQRNSRLRKAIAAAEIALEQAESDEAAFATRWDEMGLEQVPEAFGEDWNAAHDAVTSAKFAIKDAEDDWNRKDIDSNTLWLMDHNMD